MNESSMHQLSPYLFTNERLGGITRLLDIMPSDHVLAILGSGDHAFAFIEDGCTVTGVDMHPRQIAYVQYRHEALRQGNYPRFLKTYEHITGRPLTEEEILAIKMGISSDPVDSTDWKSIEERNRYFMEGERLKRISANAGNLTVVEGDLFDLPAEAYRKATKVYLSNCLVWTNQGVGKFIDNLPPGALIYSAESTRTQAIFDQHGSLSLDASKRGLLEQFKQFPYDSSVWRKENK